jgi:hypothetical protein
MRRSLGRRCSGLLLLALASGFTSGCVVGIVDLHDGDQSQDHEASSLVVRDVPVTSQEGIRFVGVNGNVRILGVSGAGEVSVRATKRVRSSTLEDAVAHLPDLQVRVRSGPGEIQVETDQPHQPNGRTYVVDYEITLPDRFWVAGVNANGEFGAEGIRSDVDLEVGNGNVMLSGLVGSAWVALGNGNLSASMFLPVGGEIVFSVGNGSAVLSIQPQVSAQLKAQVGNGTIVISGLTVTDPASGANLFRGTLGSGEGLIDITVGNGNIRVSGS